MQNETKIECILKYQCVLKFRRWHSLWLPELIQIECLKNLEQPLLVWLSELSAGLQTKGSSVQFLVRAHAWVAGQVPS